MPRKLAAVTSLGAALALSTLASTALADPAGPAGPAPTVTTPIITVYGRATRPQVVIVLRPLSAAAEAGAAHDRMRVAVMARSEPASMRSSP